MGFTKFLAYSSKFLLFAGGGTLYRSNNLRTNCCAVVKVGYVVNNASASDVSARHVSVPRVKSVNDRVIRTGNMFGWCQFLYEAV